MRNYKKIDKGIVLIIVLWVLFFISVIVFTLGFKNRMSIRLASLSNEKLRMFYLAKEGINRAILKLAQDDASFDSEDDTWNGAISQKRDGILLRTEIRDEDRLLNVNYTDPALFKNVKKIFPELNDEDLQDIYKDRPYNVAREIMAKAELDDNKLYVNTPSGRIALYELITTFGDGKLNINTVSEDLLLVIPNMTQNMVSAIIEHRRSDPFQKNETLSEDLSKLGLTPAQVSSLVKVAKVNSSVFRIFSEASSERKSVSRKLEVVVKRSEDEFKILYVKEN